MAGAIHIDDLAAPQLTAIQEAAVAYGESQPVELSVDAVLAAASARAGLDDFGPDDFKERLGVLLAEVDADDDRTGLGRRNFFADCERWAANRLLILELLARHPEIHDVEIPAPVIVIGLPRSGTTHLVNLLGADERFRSLPLWESMEPVPNPREQPRPDGVDPRWQRCQAAWEGMQATVPYMVAMHPMAPDHIHEELELENTDFSSYHAEWVCRCPGWRDYYLAHDQTPHYRWMRTVLQILQWYRPRPRWVLKCPQHLEQMGPLMATFPDATIVVTHRDPVSVVQSAATMMTYSARLGYRHPRPDYYLNYWWDRIRRLLDASMRDRHLLPEGRTYDVRFGEFMADDFATVERIYDVAGLEMTPEARTQITGYQAEHPRGRDGQVIYDLRKHFGVTPQEVRADFSEYMERFGLPAEVK